ncbi:MAG: symmetrical bis(5'-nucleosyl)-tetraphosphatase [bacterium]
MAIYAIGDVQGCVAPLEELLDAIGFDPARDRLWLTGDLVNRGRHSLETLRLVRALGDAAVAVLGNHDLHLLAIAAGVKPHRGGDTMQAILRAPDRDELLHWLRHRPLMHCDRRIKTMMVHAGVYPGWRRKQVARFAGEVEALLRGEQHEQLLRRMYGREPARWSEASGRWQRARFIINALTRMRYCDRRGELDFACKDAPGGAPAHLLAWFDHPDLKCRKWRIVFGHWSALGFFQRGNLIGLDSGCVWGGKLTALRLDGDRAGCARQVQCRNPRGGGQMD